VQDCATSKLANTALW